MVEIKQIIDAYVTNMRSIIHEKYTAKDSLTTWMGMGKVQNAPFHKELYENTKKTVEALCMQLSEELDVALAAQSVTDLLEYGREDFPKVEESIRLGLISIEALAIPLLDFMDVDAIRALCDAYIQRYPKRKMLPKQKELYKRMLVILK